MSRIGRIEVVSLVVALGFYLGIVASYVQGAYLGMGYPYNTFLFLPSDRLADYAILVNLNEDHNPYLGQAISEQYPLVNLLFYGLGLMPKPLALLLYLTAGIAGVALATARYLDSGHGRVPRIAILVPFFSYPFLITLDRGNVEILLFLFMLLSVFAIQKGHFWTGAALLAPAIAMKAYPAALLLLFVRERRFPQVALALGLALGISAVSLGTFQGGFDQNLLFLLRGDNLGNWMREKYVGEGNWVQRGASLYTATRIFLIQTGLMESLDPRLVLTLYEGVVALLGVIVVLAVVFLNMEYWKRVTLVIFAMISLPYMGGDYRLIHVLAPMLAFLSTDRVGKSDRAYAILFASLLVPKSYFFFERVVSDSGYSDIGLGSVMNPLLILVAMVTIIVGGLRARLPRAVPCRSSVAGPDLVAEASS